MMVNFSKLSRMKQAGIVHRSVSYRCVTCGVVDEYNGLLPSHMLHHVPMTGTCGGTLVEAVAAPCACGKAAPWQQGKTPLCTKCAIVRSETS